MRMKTVQCEIKVKILQKFVDYKNKVKKKKDYENKVVTIHY